MSSAVSGAHGSSYSCLRLPADPVPGARQEADEPVARAVHEHGALESDEPLRSHHPSRDRADDALVVGPSASTSCTSVFRNSEMFGSARDRLEQRIPEVRVAVGVAVLVLDEELAHDAALAGVVVVAVRGGADHPHPHFDEELPPSTGRLLTARPSSPSERAAIAAQTPASPPPTIVTSDATFSSFTQRVPLVRPGVRLMRACRSRP